MKSQIIIIYITKSEIVIVPDTSNQLKDSSQNQNYNQILLWLTLLNEV